MADFGLRAPSEEWQIDGRLEELAAKMLQGNASKEELEEYRSLDALRARKMKPHDRAELLRVHSLFKA